jgi:hypothetical protein
MCKEIRHLSFYLLLFLMAGMSQWTSAQSSSYRVSKDSLPSLHFYPKSTKLTDKAHNKIREVAAFLQDNPSIRLEVRGYSDASANLDAAKELARKRAKKAYIALMGERIDESRVRQNVILPHVESTQDTTSDKSKRQVEFALLTDFACDHIDISSFIREKAKKYDFYRNMAGYGDLTKEDLYYSVQIASVANNRPYESKLPGKFALRKESYGQYTRYMVGKYPAFCQALHWWDEMSKHGVKDVWIVAYHADVRLSSLQRARKLLKANN